MEPKDLKIFIRTLKKYNDLPKTTEKAIKLRGAYYALRTEYLIRFLEYKRDKHGVAYCEKWLTEMLNLNTKPALPNITYELSPLEDVDDELEELAVLSQNYKPGTKLPNKDLGWLNEEREIMAKSEREIDLKNLEGLARVEFWNLKDDLKIKLGNLGIEAVKSKKGKQKNVNSTKNHLSELINDFAKEFAKNAHYSVDEITRYINLWEDYQGLTNVRSRAKKEASLTNVADGTLSNWERRWTKFKNLRTQK